MVKIFINGIPLYLLKKTEEPLLDVNIAAGNNLISEDFISKKSFLSLVDKLEHKLKVKAVKVYHTEDEELFEIFKSFYSPISAAGGIVKNSKEEILMIFRRGKWDLPKGKIEKNESKEVAAVREVTEETGLKKIKLGEQLFIYSWKQPGTYHTYWEHGKRILKTTFWYKMKSADQVVLDPQFEEGITKAEWIQENELPKLMKRSYGSVADVLKEIA